MNNKEEPYQRIVRCSWSALIFCICLSIALVASAASRAKNDLPANSQFQIVSEKAKVLSATPFKSPDDVPEILKKIGYDQWRGIRFKPDRSLWFNEPFSVQFFHPGFLYQDPVVVHYIDRDGTHTFPFNTDLFSYSKENSALQGLQLEDHGFAGFRVQYPLNTSAYADELISFLGASYFRALGKDLAYGLSARGLAINTADDAGEEFPLFREYWIVRPAPGVQHIKIYALLDSNSLTGAYEFEVYPGEETIVKVSCELFMRKYIKKLGVAPLTSMFYYGENSGLRHESDFRPEVHDSDGLLVAARTGEWIWHPLINPPRLLVNSFGGEQPIGFGLMQRDINFDHYQDLEARYDRRPSVWVSHRGDWGKGHLELVQIPSDNEYNDNIVAYWVPERTFEPGDSVKYDYDLSWHSARQWRSPQSFVAGTRIVKKPDGVMFIIDFSREEAPSVLPEVELKPDVWVSRGGRISAAEVVKNTVSGGWRLVLHVKWDAAGFMDGVLPNQKPAIEFRALLRDGPRAITETWSYTYLP